MTPEKALAKYYAGQYMVNTQARLLFDLEVSKGCDSRILSNPVALEPDFRPINVPKNIIALKDGPNWIFESPPKPQDLVRFRVWLSSDQPFDWNCLELFVKQLSLVSNRVGLEISGNEKKIDFTLLCHRSDVPIVKTAFLSKLKFCKLSVATENLIFHIEPEFWEDISFYDCFASLPYHHLLTRPDELHTTPYEALVTGLATMPSSAAGIYQVLFQPVSAANNWHRNVEILTDIEYNLKLLSGVGFSQHHKQQGPSGDIHRMAGDVDTKAHNDKPFYSAAFRIAVISADKNRQKYLQSLRVFSSLYRHGGKPLDFITEADYSKILSPEQIRQMFTLGLTYRPGSLLNSDELTGLVHFPKAGIAEHLEAETDEVQTLMVTTGNRLSEGTPIGTTNVAGQECTICIPDDMRLCHIHMIGKTKMGKSTLAENMIMDDIEKGHGVAVLDPHGDLVKKLLCLLPEEVISRVIYIDLGNPNWIPLWNPMDKIKDQDIGEITDNLIGVLKSFISGWGHRMEHLLRHSIFTMLHLPGASLRDVYDILCKTEESKRTCKIILETIQEDVVRQFWKHDFENYRPDELGPPKHKLSTMLLSGTTASLMLSQPVSSFNYRQVMDEGKILLVDLSSNLGTEVKQVIGGFMLARMYIAALSRGDILVREERKSFHVYVDEAPKFVTDSLEDIISEACKYGVGLTFLHQYLGQLNAKKIGALGTVDTTIAFKIDSHDAFHLSKNFKKKVEVKDFIELKPAEAIVRCGNEIVKIKTLGPRKIPKKNFRDRIIAESRRKYYKSASEIRRMIEQRKERANKPFAPLAPVIDNRKKTFLSGDLNYDEL